MTIITQSSGDGTTRRCDATCHNAKHAGCSCICGGRYHGAGNQAQEMLTRDWLGADWRERQAQVEAAGGDFAAAVCQGIAAAGRQLTLFGLPDPEPRLIPAPRARRRPDVGGKRAGKLIYKP